MTLIRTYRHARRARPRPGHRAPAPTRLAAAIAVVVAATSLVACDPSATELAATRPIDELAGDLSMSYRTDAARLALRRSRSLAQSPVPAVEIPTPLIDRYHEALIAVWRLEHPARDSVVRIHEIHSFPDPVLSEILVSVQPGSRLALAWDEGVTLTGEPEADALIERFGLRLQRYYDILPSSPFAVLRSDSLLDAAALALRFLPVTGVRYADPNAVFGGGNDIVAREVGDALFLDYSVGWGDCPSGCLQRHTWTFRVRDGRATYVGSAGAPYRP